MGALMRADAPGAADAGESARVRRNVVCLAANGLVANLGGFLIGGTVLQAFLLEFGVSGLQLGVIGSASGVTAALAMFAFLGLADSLLERRRLAAASRLAIVALPVGLIIVARYGVPGPVVLAAMVGLASLQSMVESVHGLVYNSLFVRCLPARLRGRFTGISGFVTQLGVIGLGLLVTAWLAWQPFPRNYTICFVAAILCMVGSAIAILCLGEVPSLRVSVASGARSPLVAAWQVVRLHEFRALLAPNVLRGVTGGAGYFVFVMGWQRLQLSPQYGALLATLTAGGGLAGMAALGLLHDRYGAGMVCLVGNLGMAAGLLGAVLAPTPGWFLAFGVVHAIGSAMEGSGVPLGTYDVAPPAMIAAYNGARLLLLSGSSALSLPAIGYLLDDLRTPVPVFVAAAGLALLNGWLYWRGFDRALRAQPSAVPPARRPV